MTHPPSRIAARLLHGLIALALTLSLVPAQPAQAQTITCFTSPNPAEIDPDLGRGPNTVAVGDFNNDGNLDFATGNIVAKTISIRAGDGKGHFTLAGPDDFGTISLGTSPDAIAVGDFNNDGKPDIVAASSTAGTVLMLRGAGTGDFTLLASTTNVGTTPLFIVAGDFNRDGKLDFATANYGSNSVSIRLGNGDGTFATPGIDVAVGMGPDGVAVGDLNGDAILDLVVANYSDNTISILLGNGSGGVMTPAPPPVAVGTSPASVTLGDFNGDGKLDATTANFGSNNVSILLGNGSGGFSSPAPPPVTVATGPETVAVGDVNGDGKLDVVTAGGDFGLTLRLGKGDGTFTTPTPSTYPLGLTPFSIATGDFDGNGAWTSPWPTSTATTSRSA
jgi:hypothetical protein